MNKFIKAFNSKIHLKIPGRNTQICQIGLIVKMENNSFHLPIYE